MKHRKLKEVRDKLELELEESEAALKKLDKRVTGQIAELGLPALQRCDRGHVASAQSAHEQTEWALDRVNEHKVEDREQCE